MTAVFPSPDGGHRRGGDKEVRGAAVGVDGTVLSVALPTFSKALHASESDLPWFSLGVLPGTGGGDAPGQGNAFAEEKMTRGVPKLGEVASPRPVTIGAAA